jgi:hypothetical protein
MQELTVVTQKRYRCRHIHAAGHQCGSPALRHEHFCYYHHATRRPAPPAGKFRHLDAAEPFVLPVVVEDRTSALLVASQLLSRIASNDLDPTRAGKLLYNLQIITALLPPEPRPAAATGESPEPAQEPQPLVEDLVYDETHGILAPILELPPLPSPTRRGRIHPAPSPAPVLQTTRLAPLPSEVLPSADPPRFAHPAS